MPRHSASKRAKYLAAIYVIRCTANNRCYVGLTTSFYKADLNKPATFSRWLNHTRSLELGTHPSVVMQTDWQRYGAGCFTFDILEWTNTAEADKREMYWQDQLHPEYSNDYRWRFGRALTDQGGFELLVKLHTGKAEIVDKSEFEAIKQRLAWLERKVAVIDRRTRKPRRTSPGQLNLIDLSESNN